MILSATGTSVVWMTSWGAHREQIDFDYDGYILTITEAVRLARYRRMYTLIQEHDLFEDRRALLTDFFRASHDPT